MSSLLDDEEDSGICKSALCLWHYPSASEFTVGAITQIGLSEDQEAHNHFVFSWKDDCRVWSYSEKLLAFDDC